MRIDINDKSSVRTGECSKDSAKKVACALRSSAIFSSQALSCHSRESRICYGP